MPTLTVIGSKMLHPRLALYCHFRFEFKYLRHFMTYHRTGIQFLQQRVYSLLDKMQPTPPFAFYLHVSLKTKQNRNFQGLVFPAWHAVVLKNPELNSCNPARPETGTESPAKRDSLPAWCICSDRNGWLLSSNPEWQKYCQKKAKMNQINFKLQHLQSHFQDKKWIGFMCWKTCCHSVSGLKVHITSLSGALTKLPHSKTWLNPNSPQTLKSPYKTGSTLENKTRMSAAFIIIALGN